MTPSGRRPATAATRRRTVVTDVLRAVLSATLLLWVYYRVPLDRPLSADTGIAFGLGLLVLAVVMVWQIRSITASDRPRLRAVQVVAIGLPMLLVLFAAVYVVIAATPGSFTEVLGRTDALYYTVTVFATVGFGDIAPRSEVARIVTMIQMLVGLVAVGLIARMVIAAVDVAVRRRGGAAPPAREETEDRPPPHDEPDAGRRP
ncbi:MAG: potassium channel family protein [Pseudonocardia sediminis]